MIVLDDREIRDTLSGIDWNFSARRAPSSTVHSLHWFPGNFIAQIPSFLIQLLSEPGDLVVDPFCGSGTTGVEALRLGRRAWLSDVNRASVQVTRGKVAPFLNPNVAAELEAVRRELVWDTFSKSDAMGALGEGASPELARWFHPDTLAQLRYIWKIRESFRTAASEDLIEMLFADTLFACASTARSETSTGGRRRHHWGWIADNVLPREPVRHNAIKHFRDRVAHAISVLSLDVKIVDPAAVRIAREDARALSLADGSADLVVTSPPYVGMIDYTRANRLTYLWMNWSLEEDREAEIGARYRRNNLRLYNEYERDMRVAVSEIARVVRHGGYCAVVIGASRKYPTGGQLVLDILEENLTRVWGPVGRTPSRRRVAERRGTETPEWIAVFRK